MHLRNVALFALSACGITTSYERRDVAAQFVDAASCPAPRVAVTAIPRPASLVPPVADHAAPPPPPEIASDPERAAIWVRTHDPTPPDPYAGDVFFLAGGCARQTVYACDLEPNGDDTVSPVCRAVSATP